MISEGEHLCRVAKMLGGYTVTFSCRVVVERDMGAGVAGRRKNWHRLAPGQEILCIGCLEHRIGRTLVANDFTYAPMPLSARLRDRLCAGDGVEFFGVPRKL